MKNRILVLLFAASFLCLLSGFNFHNNNEKGKIATYSQILPEFKAVALSCPADVRIHKADETKMIVEADRILQPILKTDVKDGVLKIAFSDLHAVASFKKLTIDLYTPAIEKLEIAELGDITLIDLFESEVLEVIVAGIGDVKLQNKAARANLKIAGCGNISGRLDCEKLDAKIVDIGDIKISGNASQAEIEVAGCGNFAGYKFAIEKAQATVSGIGDIDIRVSNYLTAKVSGIGNIKVKGNPQMDAEISGLGKIKNR